MNALEGRVALMTGAGRGQYRAIAEFLDAEGKAVVIADNGAGIDGNDGNGADPR